MLESGEATRGLVGSPVFRTATQLCSMASDGRTLEGDAGLLQGVGGADRRGQGANSVDAAWLGIDEAWSAAAGLFQCVFVYTREAAQVDGVELCSGDAAGLFHGFSVYSAEGVEGECFGNAARLGAGSAAARVG
jgi:hypothetical protein